MASNPATAQAADYLIIAAYVALVVFVGWHFRQRIKGAKDFFAAGNAMPWWVAGISYWMASFSTMLFIIYNEIAYVYGLVALTVTWVSGEMVLVAGMLLAHRWRRARVITPLGFMERRYSKSVYQLFVWAGFPLRLLDNGMRIYGMAIVTLVALLGVGNAAPEAHRSQLFIIIAALGAVFVIYTWLGGQGAVMITDFVQAIILLVAVGFITTLCMRSFDGVGHLLSTLPETHRTWLQKPGQKGYDWIYLVFSFGLIAFLQNSAGWSLVQKYNCVRSEGDARKMVWVVAILNLLAPPFFFLPGLAAHYLVPEGIANTRYAFAMVSFELLPVGLMGLLLVAMFGAATSTLGAEYNTLSGVLTRDFYKRIMRPNATPEEEVAFGRWATLGIGLVTMVLAVLFYYMDKLNLMDLMMRFFGAFGPPILVPVLVGLLTPKFNSRGVWWGVIGGATVGTILVTINLVLVNRFEAEMKAEPRIDWYLRTLASAVITVSNIVVTMLGMWLGSRRYRRTEEEERHVREFFADLERPFLITAEAKAAESPFRLIGLTTMSFSVVMFVVTAWALVTGGMTQTFWLNLIAGLIIGGLGLVMWFFARRRGVNIRM